MAFRDVYQEVTNKIIAQMELAQRWQRPWIAPGARSRPVNTLGQPYHGINVPILWSAPFTAPTWGTYKAWQARGKQVLRGQKGTQVVFFKDVVKRDAIDENDTYSVVRSFTVFNAEQCEGYVAPEAPLALPAPSMINAQAEALFAASGIVVEHAGHQAFYAPSRDKIMLPPRNMFASDASYYATRAHETIHATGHPSRCNREFGKRFGDKAYGAEELVAELGAAFLCADLNVSAEPRQDHANYLADWLEIMRTDKRAIFTAASKAEQACKWLHTVAGTALAPEAMSEAAE